MKHYISHLTSHISHLTSHIRAFVLMLVMAGFCTSANSQQNQCATPDISRTQVESLLNQIPSVQIASAGNWNIPVWIFRVKGNNGFTSRDYKDTPRSMLMEASLYFDNLFNFTLCGFTYINNETYRELNYITPSTEWQDLVTYTNSLNLPGLEKCIKIFVVDHLPPGYPSGVTGWPGSVNPPSVLLSSYDVATCAHELGHYFALPHTFSGGFPVSPGTQNPDFQYVDNVVTINGITYNCYRTGDGFCDTPADVVNNLCTNDLGCGPTTCSYTALGQTVVPVDANGKSFHPDKSLIMSYYGACRTRFSGEQKSRMSALYQYASGWANINSLKTPPPVCQNYPSDFGQISYKCVNASTNVTNDAFLSGVPVIMTKNNQVCGSSSIITDANGRYNTYSCAVPDNSGSSAIISIAPDKRTDYLNGVTTADLSFISQMIIGTYAPSSPYPYIAADANNSGTITSLDIIPLRNLILGSSETLPIGSWRYVPKYCFQNAGFFNNFNDLNPFDATWLNPSTNTTLNYFGWMDKVSISPFSTDAQNQNNWSFIGVKVGDLNCSASLDPIVTAKQISFSGGKTSASSGKALKLQIVAEAEEPVIAWQMGMRFASDSIGLNKILPGTAHNFDPQNFNHLAKSGKDDFRALWYAKDGVAIDINNKVLFETIISTKKNISEIGKYFRLDAEELETRFFNAKGEEIPVKLYLTAVSVASKSGSDTENVFTYNQELEVSAYPVPFTSNVALDFNLDEESSVTIHVFDATGKSIIQQEYKFSKGPQTIVLEDMARYPTGFYWYTLETADQFVKGKLIKR